jgi:hypothetical protein
MITPFRGEPLDPRLVLARLIMGSILPATDGAEKLLRQDEFFGGVICLISCHVVILQKRPGEVRRAHGKALLPN